MDISGQALAKFNGYWADEKNDKKSFYAIYFYFYSLFYFTNRLRPGPGKA
jgi:hypothetical protein